MLIRLLLLAVAGFAVLFVYGAVRTVSPYHAGMLLLAVGGGYLSRVAYLWLAGDHEPRRDASE